MDCFLSLYLLVASVLMKKGPGRRANWVDLFDIMHVKSARARSKTPRFYSVADVMDARDMVEFGIQSGITECGQIKTNCTKFGDLGTMILSMFHKSKSKGEESFSRFVLRPDGVMIDIDAYYAAMALSGVVPSCAYVPKIKVANMKGKLCGRVLYLPESVFSSNESNYREVIDTLEEQFGGAIVVYDAFDKRDGFVAGCVSTMVRIDVGWRSACDISCITPRYVLSEVWDTGRNTVVDHGESMTGVDVSYESFAFGYGASQIGPNGPAPYRFFPSGTDEDELVDLVTGIRPSDDVLYNGNVLKKLRYNEFSVGSESYETLCNAYVNMMSYSDGSGENGLPGADERDFQSLAKAGMTVLVDFNSAMIGKTKDAQGWVCAVAALEGVERVDAPVFHVRNSSGNMLMMMFVMLSMISIVSAKIPFSTGYAPMTWQMGLGPHVAMASVPSIASQARIHELVNPRTSNNLNFSYVNGTRWTGSSVPHYDPDRYYEVKATFSTHNGSKLYSIPACAIMKIPFHIEFEAYRHTMCEVSAYIFHPRAFIAFQWNYPNVHVSNMPGSTKYSERGMILTLFTFVSTWAVVCMVMFCIVDYIHMVLTTRFPRTYRRFMMKAWVLRITQFFCKDRANDLSPFLSRDCVAELSDCYRSGYLLEKGNGPMTHDAMSVSFNQFLASGMVKNALVFQTRMTIRYINLDGRFPAWFVLRFLEDMLQYDYAKASPFMHKAKQLMLPTLKWREELSKKDDDFIRSKLERRFEAVDKMISDFSRSPEAKKKLFINFYNGSGGADTVKGNREEKANQYLFKWEEHGDIDRWFDQAHIETYDVEFDDKGEVDEERTMQNFIRKFDESHANDDSYWLLQRYATEKLKKRWREEELYEVDDESIDDEDREYHDQREHYLTHGVFDEGISRGNVAVGVPAMVDYYRAKSGRSVSNARRRRECFKVKPKRRIPEKMQKVVPLLSGPSVLKIVNPKSGTGIEVNPDGVSSNPTVAVDRVDTPKAVDESRVVETKVKCSEEEFEALRAELKAHAERFEVLGRKLVEDEQKNKAYYEHALKVFRDELLKNQENLERVSDTDEEDKVLTRKQKQKLRWKEYQKRKRERRNSPNPPQEKGTAETKIAEQRKTERKDERGPESATVTPVDIDVIDRFRSGIVSIDFGEPVNQLQRGAIVGARAAKAGTGSIVQILTVGHQEPRLWDEKTIHQVRIGTHCPENKFYSGTAVGSLVRRNIGSSDSSRDAIIVLRCSLDCPVSAFNSRIMSVGTWASNKKHDLSSFNVHRVGESDEYKWTLSTRGRSTEIYRGSGKDEILDEVETTGLNFFGAVVNGKQEGRGSSGTPLSNGTKAICALHIAGTYNSNYCIPLLDGDSKTILAKVRDFQ